MNQVIEKTPYWISEIVRLCHATKSEESVFSLNNLNENMKLVRSPVLVEGMAFFDEYKNIDERKSIFGSKIFKGHNRVSPEIGYYQSILKDRSEELREAVLILHKLLYLNNLKSRFKGCFYDLRKIEKDLKNGLPVLRKTNEETFKVAWIKINALVGSKSVSKPSSVIKKLKSHNWDKEFHNDFKKFNKIIINGLCLSEFFSDVFITYGDVNLLYQFVGIYKDAATTVWQNINSILSSMFKKDKGNISNVEETNIRKQAVIESFYKSDTSNMKYSEIKKELAIIHKLSVKTIGRYLESDDGVIEDLKKMGIKL